MSSSFIIFEPARLLAHICVPNYSLCLNWVVCLSLL